jgi:hypothetical protein
MPGDPPGGSKVWKAPDREIGKPGENRGKVIAHRDLQPAFPEPFVSNANQPLEHAATGVNFFLGGEI